jgi:hypothetical protein
MVTADEDVVDSILESLAKGKDLKPKLWKKDRTSRWNHYGEARICSAEYSKVITRMAQVKGILQETRSLQEW